MDRFKTILLVEDSPADAEMAIDALREAKLANPIVHVEEGAEALDYLHCQGRFAGRSPENPALVLLDIHMPRVNGLELLRQVRADERLRTMPVVILTSSREDRDLVQSWNLGVNAYVVKPVDDSQFLDAVKTLGYFWAVVNAGPEQ